MKVDNFITDLYKIYHTKASLAYSSLDDMMEVELISFTYGIFLILGALKIDPKEVKIHEHTLKDEIDEILKGYLKEDNKHYKEEQINDTYDKDNVYL